jgi:hypothetical protein
MTKSAKLEDLKKRENIQKYFWNEVGSVEHTSLPKLRNAIEREFKRKDDRFVLGQIKLMQTERRIKIESKVKVWIKKPPNRDTN